MSVGWRERCSITSQQVYVHFRSALLVEFAASEIPISLSQDFHLRRTDAALLQIKHTHGLSSFTISQPLGPVVASFRGLHTQWSALEQQQRPFGELIGQEGEVGKMLEEAMNPDNWSTSTCFFFFFAPSLVIGTDNVASGSGARSSRFSFLYRLSHPPSNLDDLLAIPLPPHHLLLHPSPPSFVLAPSAPFPRRRQDGRSRVANRGARRSGERWHGKTGDGRSGGKGGREAFHRE